MSPATTASVGSEASWSVSVQSPSLVRQRILYWTIGCGVMAGGIQATSIRPSRGVSLMLRTAPGVGTGSGVTIGATVNVQETSWSATATALPASSGDSNTTCGQSNRAPLTQAGMSRMIRMLTRPRSRAARSVGSRPMPTGSSANGDRLPKSR